VKLSELEKIARLKGSARLATIYLITADDVGFKIGRTTSIVDRVAKLQTSHHKEIRVIHFFLTLKPVIVEGALKRLFKSKHVRGEWYMLTPEDVLFIQRLDRGNHIELINECAMNRGIQRWRLISQ